jgi:hypothetical protein
VSRMYTYKRDIHRIERDRSPHLILCEDILCEQDHGDVVSVRENLVYHAGVLALIILTACFIINLP